MSSLQLERCLENDPDLIRARPRAKCFICGSAGQIIYRGLTDRLFGVSGLWNFRKCPTTECGLVWLDPMPYEEDLWKAYRKYYTHSSALVFPASPIRSAYLRARRTYLCTRYRYPWTHKDGWDYLLVALSYLNQFRKETFDASTFYLDYASRGKLLELGCGSGSMLREMEDLGWQVEGLDFDPNAVEQAKKSNLVVHLGTLAQQKFPDNYFDAIAASHFLEHVFDPLAVIAECRRILKPGGRLVQITPNVASWGHRFYKSNWRGLEAPRHLQIFTHSALTNLCKQAGFEVCTCRTIVRANGILRASSMLRKTGTADPKLSLTFGTRVWEELKGIMQSIALLIDKELGEELVLIATK